MGTESPLDGQIEKLLRLIPPPAGDAADAASEEALKAYQELQVALEELRVADEEMRQQNEELARARHALETERERYQDLFEFAPDAYLVTTPEGTILEANRVAAALLNTTGMFLAGKPLLVFVPPEERKAFRGELSQVLESRSRHEWEGRLRPRKGTSLEVLVTAAAVRGREGRPVAVRWLLRDIGPRKQAIRLAAIGQMVAGLAHESRNALQRSQACLERLSWQLPDRPEALDLVARAQKAQDHLHRLFDDIRDYAGPLALETALCDLGEVWREAWGQVAWAYSEREPRLAEDTGGLDLGCEGDRFRLGQVFRNLLDNALAASPAPARVEVGCAEVELRGRPALRVSVRDQGPGLSQEQRQKLFEPFYTTKVKGMGLGLAIARRIVEAHGGWIAVAEGAGPGAEVHVILPRRRA